MRLAFTFHSLRPSSTVRRRRSVRGSRPARAAASLVPCGAPAKSEEFVKYARAIRCIHTDFANLSAERSFYVDGGHRVCTAACSKTHEPKSCVLVSNHQLLPCLRNACHLPVAYFN